MTAFVHHELPLLAEIDRFAPMVTQPAPPDILTIRVPGEMRGKGRHRTRRLPNGQLQTFPDAKTVSAENLVAWCAKEQVGSPMLSGPVALTVHVTFAIPRSWSKRKQADALAGIVRPTVKPDASNLVKLLEDALNKIVWIDDVQIVDLHVHKHYGPEPGAVLEVRAL